MILKTASIKSSSKVLGMIPATPLDDFVFLDPQEKRVYISNRSTACRIDVEIDDVQDNDSIMIIDRSTFQHLISAGDELTINSDYTYVVGPHKGVIEHNETLLDTLDSIKVNFEPSEYELKLTCDSTILAKLMKGSCFVNPDDNNMSQRGVHLIDGKISSASMFRIYVDSIDTNVNLFLQHDILKFVFELGDNTSILQHGDRKTIKLQNNNVCMIFTSVLSVTPLMINSEKFVSSINSLKENVCIKVNAKELLSKVDFMMFFSKKNVNNLSTLKFYDGNKLSIVVGENDTSCDCSLSSKEELEFNYDNSILKDVLSKINKDVDDVSIFCSNDANIFIVEFTETQFVVLSKIKL